MILRFRGFVARLFRHFQRGAPGRPRAPDLRLAEPPPPRVVELQEYDKQPAEAQPPSPLPPPPRRAPTQPAIVIGLDFGTYSTKVLIRRRGEPSARMARIEGPVDGYPAFASPSLVRVSAGAAYLGGAALADRGGTLFRALKVELLEGRDGGDPDKPALDLLVALYLSWALRKVKALIDQRYGEGDPKVFLNVAAPMNHLENAALKSRYLRIVRAAWESVFGAERAEVEQGISFQDAARRFEPWLRDTSVPDAAERAYDVLPETIAPIVSLSQDPRMGAGMYLIVDLGAGTTELSINHVAAPGGDQNVLCYYDESLRLGAAQFENPVTVEDSNRLITELLTAVRHTWGRGYLMDCRSHDARPRWKQLSILLAGGGTCRPDVQTAIRRDRRAVMYAFPPQDTTYVILRHVPLNIDFGLGRDTNPEDAFLLAVANGLSFPRRQWPVVFLPADVDELPPTPERERGDPLWYLER